MKMIGIPMTTKKNGKTMSLTNLMKMRRIDDGAKEADP
jgi:hypothetical protein